jgi:error-prone DNA polymerase
MLNQYPLGFYSPATLVKDAQRHGVRVLPIDVQSSRWHCQVGTDGAVRLGLRYVYGLREEAASRIAAGAPFDSVADLARRAGLHRDELEKLAESGTCASLGLERREAMWQVAALQGGLLSGAASQEPSPLREMSELEQTLADYRGTGMTTGPHLMSYLRARLRHHNVLPARDLKRIPDGRWVRTAGVVIVRQRPLTAKGFLFMTLEDETGTSNAIVAPDLLRKQHALLQTAGVLLIEGPLQNQDGVIHVRARRFQRLELPSARALPPSRDFR